MPFIPAENTKLLVYIIANLQEMNTSLSPGTLYLGFRPDVLFKRTKIPLRVDVEVYAKMANTQAEIPIDSSTVTSNSNVSSQPNNPLSRKLNKILETRLDNDKVRRTVWFHAS